MSTQKANLKQNVGVQIERAAPPAGQPITLTLIFGHPNNDARRRMMVQVPPGGKVDVMAGTFPLTVIRED